MSVYRALSRLHSVRGQSIVEATVYPWTQPCQGYCVSVDCRIVEATVFPWTEHCRGYCLSVDRALSNLHLVLGQSIVEATLFL